MILNSSDEEIRFEVDVAGYNLGSFEFVEKGLATTDVPTQYTDAVTLDEYSIRMDANKFLDAPLPTAPGGFEIVVDGNSVPISSISVDPDDARRLIFEVDYLLKSTETIEISYSGTDVQATDGTSLSSFTLEEVENTLLFVHQLPGKVEAEAYSFQIGVELEESTDVGGGSHIAFLDPGDYLDYEINVTMAGTYRIDYRNASQDGSGGLDLKLIDISGSETDLTTVDFTPTGGWQNWATTSQVVDLPEGRYLLRVTITASPFNLNWIEFLDNATNISPVSGDLQAVSVYPNPSREQFQVHAQLADQQDVQLQVFNYAGQMIFNKSLTQTREVAEQVSLEGQAAGLYHVVLRMANGQIHTEKLVKAGQ